MKIKAGLPFLLVSLFLLCPNPLWAKSVPVQTARKAAVHRMNQHNRVKALHQQRKDPARPQAAGRIKEADACAGLYGFEG